MPRALKIIVDVANPLRMSAEAMLLRTGSQSVLVHRSASVMVLSVVFSCTSTRLVLQNSSKQEHSTQPQSNRGPMLMFEEFLHLLPRLCQLACGPNCYESGFLQQLSEDMVCK